MLGEEWPARHFPDGPLLRLCGRGSGGDRCAGLAGQGGEGRFGMGGGRVPSMCLLGSGHGGGWWEGR